MSFHCFTAHNGTKQFGHALWFNPQRVGLQINFWIWEIQIMKEWR